VTIPFMTVALVLGLLLLFAPLAHAAHPVPAATAPGMTQEPDSLSAPLQADGAQTEQAPAEDEHAAETDEVAPKPWWHWPAKWINFISLIGLLYWMLVIPPAAVQDIFSYPGLKVIFVERAAAIVAARDLAAEQGQHATQMLEASEQRLATIEEEVGALVAEARRDADREAERAGEDGKTQAQKIHQMADREITNERVAAQRQLRRFVADLAVNLAEKSLAEHLTADDQDRLIREYLSHLGPSMA
jgi:F-type H+-transporting ATPase subunit b